MSNANTKIEMKTDAELEKLLKRALVQLLLDYPFFGTLAMRLPNELVGPEHVVNTAATDSTKIMWNREWLSSLPFPQIKGVLAHEVLHVANGHCWRRSSRNPKAWNVACDKSINHILKECKFELPADGCFPKAHECGRAAESLYNPQDADSGFSGGLSPDDVLDAPAEQTDELKEKWAIAASQAAIVAKSQGKLPGDLERMIKDAVQPKVDPETILREFVQRSARNDYNFSRPNRSYVQAGLMMPTLVSDELPPVVVVMDTSGSMGQREIDAAQTMISNILESYETTIHVVYVDSAVRGTIEITRADLPLKLKALGGGGTCFEPAFKWVDDNAIQPACLLYITDLYGSFPSDAPDYPVAWLLTHANDKMPVPFGEVVSIL